MKKETEERSSDRNVKSLGELLALANAKMKLDKINLLESYKSDFEKFALDNLKIRPKDVTRGYIPLKLLSAQKIIHEKIEAQRAKTGKVRAIILKARQQGISVYCAGRTYWRTTTNPLYQTVLIAHDQRTADVLFETTNKFHELQNPETKPKLKTSNKKELTFEELDSTFRVYTAGSGQVGRGNTPTIIHSSETAFWGKGEEIIAGLFQGVSDTEGTEIIMESTANGASGEFYRLWQGAVNGDNEFIPIFLPWFLTEEYKTPDKYMPKDFELTHEEDEYCKQYDLTDEQMHWRRLRIYRNGEEAFKQEYPSNPEEAFLRSGNTVFPTAKLAQIVVKKPVSVERFDPLRTTFDINAHGHMEVWQHRSFNRPEEEYIIGADVAQGVGKDYSVAVVMNNNFQICAMFRDNEMNPGEFGEVLFTLGRDYKNCLIICESNGPGVAALHQLAQMNYPHIYNQTKIHQVSKEEMSRPGFNTNMATKPLIISGLSALLAAEEIEINSNIILNELRTYISTKTGKMEAAEGCTDDTVIATALCVEGIRTHGHNLSIGNRWVNWKKLPEPKATKWI